MRTYFPTLKLGVLQGPQTYLRPKFGGQPWGFPAELWPQCAECEGFMVLVAQLPHQLPAIDLGNPRCVLHLFQCSGEDACTTWELESGCNAAIVLNLAQLESELSEGLAPTALHGEAFIDAWEEGDDGVSSEILPAYFDWRQYLQLQEEQKMPHRWQPRWMTKAGGAPNWTANGPQTVPPLPYEFLLQIGTFLFFEGQMPAAADAGCMVRINDPSGDKTTTPPEGATRPNAPYFLQQNFGEHMYYAEWVNFGSDGTAYVFIDRTVSPPKVLWCWNR
jgi:hypothetical protein